METNLCDSGTLKRLLQKHAVLNDKSLGQHFLISSKVVRQIVNAVEDSSGILEIGPGPGCLTQPLSQNHTVLAVEADNRMLPVLQETSPNAKVVVGDALNANLADYFAELPSPASVVSNLPYYITGPLLQKIFDVRSLWESAVLMMQYEVGEKILAEPGDRLRGALSVVAQGLFDIELVCLVPAGAFMPPPKVNSLVLKFTPRETQLEDGFIKFVRTGFTQPRKTLANNLKQAYPKVNLEAASLQASIRPHQLTEEDWMRLYEQVNP